MNESIYVKYKVESLSKLEKQKGTIWKYKKKEYIVEYKYNCFIFFEMAQENNY
jgi:hypothetical protein